VPPETTVAELLVDFGAVVVVEELDVVGVGAVVADVDDSDDELVFEAEMAFAALAVLPGTSEETRPPKTAAVSAAPPTAVAVTRRTLRSAFALSLAFTFCDMTPPRAAVGRLLASDSSQRAALAGSTGPAVCRL